MKKQLFITLFLALAVISCKKEKTSEPASGTLLKMNGVLWSNIDSSFNTNSFTSGGRAFFYEPAVVNGRDYKDAGKVYLNGDSLYKQDNEYFGPYANTNPGIEIWSVTGSSLVPAFTYTNTSPYPYCNPREAPDSMSLGDGTSFNINLVNSDSGDFFITSPDTVPGIYIKLKPGINSINIPNQKFRGFTPSTVTIQVDLYNQHFETIGSKEYVFIKRSSWKKPFKLKP